MPPIPTAPDHTWHTPYLRALEISGVPEPKRQWFVGWVERFVADRTDAEVFIRSLESNRRMEPWRLRQASDAVRLLLTAFFGKRWDAEATVPGGNTLETSADPHHPFVDVVRVVRGAAHDPHRHEVHVSRSCCACRSMNETLQEALL